MEKPSVRAVSAMRTCGTNKRCCCKRATPLGGVAAGVAAAVAAAVPPDGAVVASGATACAAVGASSSRVTMPTKICKASELVTIQARGLLQEVRPAGRRQAVAQERHKLPESVEGAAAIAAPARERAGGPATEPMSRHNRRVV